LFVSFQRIKTVLSDIITVSRLEVEAKEPLLIFIKVSLSRKEVRFKLQPFNFFNLSAMKTFFFL